MGDLKTFRLLCRQSLDEVSSAEDVYREALEEIDRSADRANQRVISEDDDIDRSILDLQSRAEMVSVRSARTLNGLRLSRAQPDPYTLGSNLGVQGTLQKIRDLVYMCEETSHEMEALAEKLREERKKWWKFW